ncbi:MAG: hypothetical protein [Microviridae sp.]|nr:MAG: hypothetical protein [Microviridae sp.]
MESTTKNPCKWSPPPTRCSKNSPARLGSVLKTIPRNCCHSYTMTQTSQRLINWAFYATTIKHQKSLYQPLKRLCRLMKQAKRVSKKEGLQGPLDNSFLDVIVRSDTIRWKLPKKRGLLTTLKLLIIYLKRKYHETFKNVS